MNLKLTILLLSISIFVILMAILDIVVPYRYDEVRLDRRFLPPSINHLFGTDSLGRDVFTRVLYGTRFSLTVSSLSLALSATLGTLIGILSALSKHFHTFADLVMNFFYIVPSIFVATITAFVIGFGIHVIAIAIVFRFLPMFYRVTRTIALTVSVEPYIESVRAVGASTLYVLTHYIARETISTVAILSIYSFPETLSIEISLNFIGLGVQPPTPSLGSILAESVKYVVVAPHNIVPPILVVFAAILLAEILGESIKKHLDSYNVDRKLFY
ncbi:MAG: ABC transporter permease [Ignisphaera sp.]|uniref:ABC transporter permease n=1 Tax=Ignisphaera aggregans TaxID=334771 RepID=A0A7J3MZV2_9CREN